MLTYESGEFAYNQGHNIYGTLEQKAALRAIVSWGIIKVDFDGILCFFAIN